MRWLLLPIALMAVTFASVATAQDSDDEADAGPETKLKETKTADKVDARDHLPENVTITFGTTPSVSARVMFGKRELCVTPCTITRKRDSGPLDVVFRAGGFLPLHTRAFTFKDDKVVARMVAEGSESKVLGFKEPIDGGVEDPPPSE